MPLHPPLSVALAWPSPNYVDPITRGKSRMIVTIILSFLVLLVLVLRFYTRLSLTKVFNSDDILIALTTVSTSGFLPSQGTAIYKFLRTVFYASVQCLADSVRCELLRDTPYLGHPTNNKHHASQDLPCRTTHLRCSNKFGETVTPCVIPSATRQ